VARRSSSILSVRNLDRHFSPAAKSIIRKSFSFVLPCRLYRLIVNFRIHDESRYKFVFVCQAVGISLYPLLVKACGVDLVHLVSWIAAIAILYFRSSLIIIRRPPVLISVRIHISGGHA
jgi:hypothetical protein